MTRAPLGRAKLTHTSPARPNHPLSSISVFTILSGVFSPAEKSSACHIY